MKILPVRKENTNLFFGGNYFYKKIKVNKNKPDSEAALGHHQSSLFVWRTSPPSLL
jgi:hypothetical protein